MADEAAENVGGISVEIGANHARLPGDIAAADKVFEQARARWEAPIVLRAQAVQPAQQQVVRPAQAPSIAVGPGSSTRAQSAQAQTALQRAINAELSKTGEIYNSQTGEIESATKATHAQRQAVVAVQAQASQPTALAIDTKPLQADLQAVLATMREIVAEAQKIAQTPVAPPVAALAGGSANNPRRYVTSRRGLTDEQRRAANYLNANPPPQQPFSGLPSDTNVNRPGYRSNEDEARQRGPVRPTAQVQADIRRNARTEYNARREAFDQSQSQATAQAFAASRRVRQFQIDEEQQARTVASRRAAITGSGRTSRTLASGLGALFGGTEQRQIEAQAAASQAARQLSSAERAIEPLDQRIRELQRTTQTGSKATRQFAQEQINAIKGSDEYRGALVNVQKAVKADADAQEKLNKISSAPSVARNLVAITAAGAAFSLGLKAIDIGIQAATRTLDPYLQQATGFIGITNELTSSLADQARQQQGNVKGVVAGQLANSGLAAATAATISPIIEQRASIEAGNKAITDQIALIRAAQQLSSQAPTAGLGSTTGGFLGTPLFGIPSTGEQIGGLLSQGELGAAGGTQPNARGEAGPRTAAQGASAAQAFAATPAGQQAAAAFAKDLAYVNAQLDKGGDSAAKFAQSLDPADKRIEETARAFDGLSPQMAKAIRDGHLYSDSIRTIDDAVRSLSAINFAGTLPDLSLVGQQALQTELFRQRASAATLPAIRSQQAFASGPQIAAIQREQLDTLLRTLPATQALGNLAHPLLPTTTGLTGSVGGQQIAANPQEASRITSSLREANSLQAELNAGYKEGRQVIRDTYDPAVFKAGGAAAVTAFHAGLDAVEATGQRIAQIQAGISNEQAAYQTAQYNFQLQIARRTLSDIGGLTDHNFGAGESYLGVLERQNLALSRQGQLLSFALSQRQINFQTALAGFQAPGVTPEERQARIAEAKAEAAYAQKQLDIQKQSFKNQVKIVDISNLRQGADLAHQIALLVQGRKVTIDTAVAEKKLALLATKQDQNIAKVSAYFKTVDSLTAQGMANVNQLELAYGHAIVGITQQILGSFGVYIKGLDTILGGYNGYGNRSNPADSSASAGHASGGIFNTRGMTRLTNHDIVGEASGETVAILSHPRALGTGGGGVSVVVNFTGDIKAGDPGDLEKVTAAVIKGLGRQASLLGLRGVG